MKQNIGRLTTTRQSKAGQMELVKQEKFAGLDVGFYQDENGDVYMTRNQIGEALGYAQPQRAMNKIHERNKERLDKFSVVVKLGTTDGKFYDTHLYSEKGIYEIMRKSNQPKADEFYDFVYDIIKSLRKGELQVVQHSYQIDDPIARAKQWIKEEEQRQRLQLENEEMKPLATYAESISEAGDDILIGELAKLLKQNGYDTGQNRLFEQLRREGYLQSRQGDMYNMPSQRSMEMGLFRIVKRVVSKGSEEFVYSTPKVTAKGQIYFVNRYCNNK